MGRSVAREPLKKVRTRTVHGRAALAVGVGEGASDGGAGAAAVEVVEAVAMAEATNGWAVPGSCLSLCM